MKKKWFKKAIYTRAPYKLGWKKVDEQRTRIRKALASRPKTWSLAKKRLSAARALQALSNVSKDKETVIKARLDAKKLFIKARTK